MLAKTIDLSCSKCKRQAVRNIRIGGCGGGGCGGSGGGGGGGARRGDMDGRLRRWLWLWMRRWLRVALLLWSLALPAAAARSVGEYCEAALERRRAEARDFFRVSDRSAHKSSLRPSGCAAVALMQARRCAARFVCRRPTGRLRPQTALRLVLNSILTRVANEVDDMILAPGPGAFASFQSRTAAAKCTGARVRTCWRSADVGSAKSAPWNEKSRQHQPGH
ncbi:Protein of unknown function [Gryllus bimaculatus]|nr:Protein of unknown function [Gryllus bimaculatus]